jgi:hypothetical protein
VKARIINKDYAEGDRDVEVLFNPERYRIGKRSAWREHGVILSDLPRIEFVGGERRRLDVSLVVDTSVDRRDVRAEISRIEAMAGIDPDLHRPPHLLFSWGSLQFDCVLEELQTRYVLFEQDGTPLRALCELVFRERIPGEEKDSRPLQSPDRAKRRVLREGDTLPLLAYQEYQDPGKWRLIAELNDMDDPLALSAGEEILVPPFERRSVP